jgi:PAS domain S-box-containing protein
MTRPALEQMSRAQLVAYLREVEGRLSDDAERRVLVHDLQVHQQELEAQQRQLIETQQALETARDHYAALFELAPLGYAMLDLVGSIDDINLAALRLIGVSDRLRVAHMPLVSFVAEEDRQTFRAHLRVLRAGAESSQTEVRLRPDSNGDARIVQVFTRPWTQRETGDMRYLTALIDVTARRHAEEDRRAAEAERRTLAEEERAMRAANEAKDRFLAALSHELRTPLTPIALALDALVMGNEIPPALAPTLRMVRRNIEHEARLIDDLLDVTRIAHDKLRCEHVVVEVHALLRDVHAIFEQEASNAGIALALDLLATESYVVGDPVRLKQVVSNLLRNAIRHTGRGGRIIVRSRTPAPMTIRITVVDTGDGIPPGMLQRIFIPFEQADPAQGTGLGLGLAIAKGLVEQHGGRIGAQSGGQGSGATFDVDLPTVQPPAHAGTAAAPVEKSTRDTTVLLVEDHADSAEAMELGLAAAGYRVLAADSVRAALEQATRSFDIVVSDIGLPDGTGHDVMRGLLAHRPVLGIALSGFGAAADVRDSRDAGFQRHLVKPVDLSQLIEAIETLLAPAPPSRRP